MNATGWSFFLEGIIVFIFSIEIIGTFADAYFASVQAVLTIGEIFIAVSVTQFLIGVVVIVATTPYVRVLLRIPLAIQQKVLAAITDEPVTASEISEATNQDEESVNEILAEGIKDRSEIGFKIIGSKKVYWRKPTVKRTVEAVVPAQR